jgi:Flp pilus assembly protein TadD
VVNPEYHRSAIVHLTQGLRELTAYTGYHYIGESHYELSRHAERQARMAQTDGQPQEAARLMTLSRDHLIEAVQAYERALAINPVDANSAWNLSVILRRMGREDLADEPLRPLVRWEPIWYRQRLVDPMLETLNLGQSHEALSRLEFLREIEPENPLYVALRAEAFLRLRETQRAREAIVALGEQFPEERSYQHLDVELAIVEGRLEEAVELAHERRESAPAPFLALESIALRGMGRDREADEAETLLRDAMDESGDPPGAAENFLGNTAWDYLGDRDLAERYYLRTADDPPGPTRLLYHRMAIQAATRGEREAALALLDRIAEPFEPAETLRQTLLQEES